MLLVIVVAGEVVQLYSVGGVYDTSISWGRGCPIDPIRANSVQATTPQQKKRNRNDRDRDAAMEVQTLIRFVTKFSLRHDIRDIYDSSIGNKSNRHTILLYPNEAISTQQDITKKN